MVDSAWNCDLELTPGLSGLGIRGVSSKLLEMTDGARPIRLLLTAEKPTVSFQLCPLRVPGQNVRAN